ncbi:hypothetical protein ACWGJB_37645 [Streptomyces sp. NPDC054813]
MSVTINGLVAEALDIVPDDVFMPLITVSNANFSFGQGELKFT